MDKIREEFEEQWAKDIWPKVSLSPKEFAYIVYILGYKSRDKEIEELKKYKLLCCEYRILLKAKELETLDQQAEIKRLRDALASIERCSINNRIKTIAQEAVNDALEDRKSCKGCKYEPELECTAECSRHIYDDMFKGW